MRDAACAELLRWAAAEVGLRYEGYRRVRGQVCKRIGKRLVALGLPGPSAYRAFLATHPEERAVLEELCRVHVSRFHRDRAVFEAVRERVLPRLALAAAPGPLRVWSAGCAAGEEPYTVALIWHFAVAAAFPGTPLQIVATDADPDSLERARRASYIPSSLKELPRSWREAAFVEEGGRCTLRAELRAPVELRCEDIRAGMPAGPFHLVLCRNLVFTYFPEEVQRELAARLVARLAPEGALLIGARERLPAGAAPVVADRATRGLFWKTPPG
jgi:chemotaxis protein methyltransferase CheR